MSYIETRSKYHVALNGLGLILQGAPDSPAYQQSQLPTYGNRFASGDRTYNELSQWWYFVQTDWTGGLKDSTSWEDDAKYYFSTNIDAWSELGSVKLARQSEDMFGVGPPLDAMCGVEADIGGTTYRFVGTDDDTDDMPNLYRESAGIWADVAASNLDTNRIAISQLIPRIGRLWVLCHGTGSSTDAVNAFDGTTFTDNSTFITTATTSADCVSCRTGVDVSGTLYLFPSDKTNFTHGLVKTTVANPSVAGDYTVLFERTGNSGAPIACAHYDGFIYYLLSFSTPGYFELRSWDITNAVDSLVRTFQGGVVTNEYGVGDRLLVKQNGKLIITVPNNEIWELDGSVLTRIWVRDEFKRTELTSEKVGSIRYGCVLSDNKLWWGNLMYDGSVFHNTFRPQNDSTGDVRPLFADGQGRIFFAVSDNRDVKRLTLTAASYKSTADANYIVFSNHDKLSGIDKLARGVTVNFKPLAFGQSIAVEYSTSEMSGSISFTALGTASFALDGASVTSKTFFFPATTTFKKMWFRVKLLGGGSDTPTMTDFVMEYLPVPMNKKQWSLRLNCGDEVRRLDGALVDKVARELRSLIESAWWTQAVLDFQDLDYATDLLNGAVSDVTATTITVDSTANFPEAGRIRIDDEEILYTGKTPTTFTGCTRGARSTRAATHSDNAVVNNAYKVLVTNKSETVPVMNRDLMLEYIVSLTLREA